MRLKRYTSAIALASVTAALVGCGGNGGGGDANPNPGGEGRSGGVALTVTWPERTRLIPNNAERIRVKVLQGTTEVSFYPDANNDGEPDGASSVGSILLNRPTTGTTSTTHVLIPAGTYVIQAEAMPTGQNSVPTAKGTSPLVIKAGEDAPFGIVMASTLSHLHATVKNATGATLFTGSVEANGTLDVPGLRIDERVKVTLEPKNGPDSQDNVLLLEDSAVPKTIQVTPHASLRQEGTATEPIPSQGKYEADFVPLRTGALPIQFTYGEQGFSKTFSVALQVLDLGLQNGTPTGQAAVQDVWINRDNAPIALSTPGGIPTLGNLGTAGAAIVFNAPVWAARFGAGTSLAGNGVNHYIANGRYVAMVRPDGTSSPIMAPTIAGKAHNLVDLSIMPTTGLLGLSYTVDGVNRTYQLVRFNSDATYSPAYVSPTIPGSGDVTAFALGTGWSSANPARHYFVRNKQIVVTGPDASAFASELSDAEDVATEGRLVYVLRESGTLEVRNYLGERLASFSVGTAPTRIAVRKEPSRRVIDLITPANVQQVVTAY